METFLNELAKPAEGYRVNLQDIRKGLAELREGNKTIRVELREHFSDLDSRPPHDLYGKKMWRFMGEVTDQLADLTDQVTHAEEVLLDVLKYYGEDEKTMTSAEFYGIFKTFVTSYRKCKVDNEAAHEERVRNEKWKQAAEELKAARAEAAKNVDGSPDISVLDSLLEKLRSGETVARTGRARANAGQRMAAAAAGGSLSPRLEGEGAEGEGVSGTGATTADIAKDMLAALKKDLKKDGFEAFPSSVSATSGESSPMPSRHTRSASAADRRSRLRAGVPELTEEALAGGAETPRSPGAESPRTVETPKSPSGTTSWFAAMKLGSESDEPAGFMFDLASPTDGSNASQGT
jgi:cytokinesis protein